MKRTFGDYHQEWVALKPKRHKAATIIGRAFRRFKAEKQTRASRLIDRKPSTSKPEMKFNTISIDRTFVSAGGSDAGTGLLAIAQGTDFNQRIGRRIVVKSVQLAMTFRLHLSAASDTIRWWVGWVGGSDTSTVVSAAAWYEQVTNSGQANLVYGGRNFNQTQDVTVLAMGRMQLDNVAPGGLTNGREVFVERFIKLNNACQYNGTTAQNPVNGQMVFYCAGMLTSNLTICEGNARINFIDV